MFLNNAYLDVVLPATNRSDFPSETCLGMRRISSPPCSSRQTLVIFWQIFHSVKLENDCFGFSLLLSEQDSADADCTVDFLVGVRKWRVYSI